ncbi:type II secretion system F family protein [Romboutsia sp.]|uniref:type II secretion system F family protein n=1 Tax=Romboutsia sp. TaxID=1965302 RepID=UPI003F34C955
MSLSTKSIDEKKKKEKVIQTKLEAKLQKYNNKLEKYNKIKHKEIKLICKKMSILLCSGHEITKIIEILSQESNKKISKIFLQIANHILKGNSITQSFKNTNLFSKFFISMLMAGEVSGNLDKVMDDLGEYYDKEDKLKTKAMTISIYPLILIALSVCTMIFMLIFVIPNFQMVFVNNNIKPPILTRILIGLSIFMRRYYLILILGFFAVTIGLYYLIKTNKRIKYLKDLLKLKVPFLRDITQLIITTRFCRTLSILIQSGINIVDAIEISSKVVDNEIVYKNLLVTNEYIKKGNNISYSIEKSNVFSKTFISMVKVGEESGNLEKTLNITNKFYTEELNLRIEQLIKFMEPIVTIIIGIIIGIFVISMIMPIFDAINSI